MCVKCVIKVQCLSNLLLFIFLSNKNNNSNSNINNMCVTSTKSRCATFFTYSTPMCDVSVGIANHITPTIFKHRNNGETYLGYIFLLHIKMYDLYIGWLFDTGNIFNIAM